MSQIRHFMEEAMAWLTTLLAFVGALLLSGLLLRAFAPLGPPLTLVLIALFTLSTFGKATTTLLSLGGIAVYVASWPVMKAWGPWAAATFCLIGMLSWLLAVSWQIFFPPPEMRAPAWAARYRLITPTDHGSRGCGIDGW
jgi:hypothetical protein